MSWLSGVRGFFFSYPGAPIKSLSFLMKCADRTIINSIAYAVLGL